MKENNQLPPADPIDLPLNEYYDEYVDEYGEEGLMDVLAESGADEDRLPDRKRTVFKPRERKPSFLRTLPAAAASFWACLASRRAALMSSLSPLANEGASTTSAAAQSVMILFMRFCCLLYDGFFSAAGFSPAS